MKINQVNLRQVKNYEGGVRLNSLAELFDAVAAHPADQAQDCPGTVHFGFNSEHCGAIHLQPNTSPMQVESPSARTAYATCGEAQYRVVLAMG